MSDSNTILNYLNEGNFEKFLHNSHELPHDYWNDFKNLRSLISAIRFKDLGMRDYIYRSVLNLEDKFKPIAANYIIDFLYHIEKELRNLASDLLIKLGEHSNQNLLQLLSEEDVDVKKFACDILGYTGTDEEIPDIVMLLNDKDMNVFNSAVESIGAIFERHKEKIGLADSMVNLLISIYNVNNLDTKPVIIESIAKIGGDIAVDFLVDLLDKEDDIFIKTAVIDGLAICGNSPFLCDRLLSELNNYPNEIQPVILKTIIAISFRIGHEVNISDEVRHIAWASMQDIEPDIRTAGLLALNGNYTKEDIPLVVDQYINNSDELRYYILTNLFNDNNIELFEFFLQNFLSKIESGDNNVSLFEMIGIIHNISEEIEYQNLSHLLKVFVVNLKDFIRFEQYEIFDNLYQVNHDSFRSIIAELSFSEENPAEFTQLNNYLLENYNN